MLKIAFYTYPSAFQNIGGGEVLLLKLREALGRQGVTVDLFDSWQARIENYDALHIFGSVKDCLGLALVARSRGVKIAVTPLWWSDLRRAFFTDGSAVVKANFVARHLAKLAWPAFPSSRRKLLLAADILFPNSESEKHQIARLFAVSEKNMRVMPNGVDPRFLDADATLFHSRYGSGPFVLGVGRIEPRKNQLNLIRAVKRIPGQKLVLIGSAVSGFESYEASCRREGQGFTSFIPTLRHEDPLLASAYAACQLFVLQGWFETPGLAALEAALAGARVVATQGGSTREYFKDFVDYINPASPEHMRRMIVKNLGLSRSPGLKEHVLQNFTWEAVAQATVRCYEEMVTARTTSKT